MPVGRDLLGRFYAAFAVSADWCAPDVRFWDPVFQESRAAEAGAMRRMLAGSLSGLQVEPIADNAHGGSARQAVRLAVLMPGSPLPAWPARRGSSAALGQVLAPRGHAG